MRHELGPHYHNGGQTLDDEGPDTAISTWLGWSFDIADPDSWRESIHLDDIAQALSATTRFGGHVEFYSVAEHSCRVSAWLEDHGHDLWTQWIGLHHDSTEAYLGDIPRPIKSKLKIMGVRFAEYEMLLLPVILEVLGIPFDPVRWNDVKAADHAVYLEERSERPCPSWTGMGSFAPHAARQAFLDRHQDLLQLTTKG